VKRLALAPGGEVARDAVCAALWPTADPDHARASLHRTIYVARRILDPRSSAPLDAYVRVEDGKVRLAARDEPAWTDVAAFLAAADRAQRSRTRDDLLAAAERYPGDLLPDNPYDDWATAPRERLRARWLHILDLLADTALAARDNALAQSTLTRLVEADPTHQSAVTRLMRLTGEHDEPRLARQVYRRYRQAIAELGVETATEVEQLYVTQIRPRLREWLPLSDWQWEGKFPAAEPSPSALPSTGLRVSLLGGFCVTIDGIPLPAERWRSAAAASLVKLLALNDGSAPVDEVSAALWPLSAPDVARVSFYRALRLARTALDPTAPRQRYLAVQRSIVRLADGHGHPIETDVQAFEGAAALAEKSDRLADYLAACAAYPGHLLPESGGVPWVVWPRARLRARWRSTLARLSELAEARGDEAIAKQTNEWLAMDTRPSRDQRAEQQRALSVRRARAIRTGSPAELPTPASSFVGRARDLAAVRRLLARLRLVTIVGPGGVGKTRLALALATTPGLCSAVWFVALDHVVDPANVDAAVAATFGRRETGLSLIRAVADLVGQENSLLILDNCEHLAPAVGTLVGRLLRAAPPLRILATSRARLGVRGETVAALDGLALPPETTSTATELLAYDSARLFVERARSAWPDFALDNLSVAALARLCRHLDGLPLGIELAAQRVASQSVEAIADCLADGLAGPERNEPGAPGRHQSLRAALDWSYYLLSDLEKTLFRRLAAFGPGWSSEAVAAVTGDPRLPNETIPGLLERLVAQSLVSADESRTETRYRLLEPTRQYAADKLAASGEANEVRARHAAFYLTLAETAETAAFGPEQKRWLDRLDGERANLRVALAGLIERGDAERAQALAGSLWRFWHARGTYSEGRRWLERAIALGGPDTEVRGKALNGAGQLARFAGDYRSAEALFQAAVDVRRTVGDQRRVADSLSNLGYLSLLRGDLATAMAQFLEVRQIRSAEGDRQGQLFTAHNLADVSRLAGQYELAAAFAREGIAHSVALGDLLNEAGGHACLARIALARSDLAESERMAKDALTCLEALGHAFHANYARRVLGETRRQRADGEGARACFTAALEDHWAMGDLPATADALTGLGYLALARQNLAGAAELLGAATALAQDAPDRWHPMRVVDREVALTSLRQAAGADFATLWREGTAHSVDEIVEKALAGGESNPATGSGSALAALTAREREVARLVAAGKTSREVGEALGITARTVDTHVGRLLRKLQVAKRDTFRSLAIE
jgi:non-specific serine/threonine protein kinase